MNTHKVKVTQLDKVTQKNEIYEVELTTQEWNDMANFRNPKPIDCKTWTYEADGFVYTLEVL